MSATIKVDQYTELQVGKNNKGEITITQGWVNNRGEFKPTWVTEKWGKEKTDKVVGKGIKLGDEKTASKVLHEILEKINGAPF